MKRLTSLATRAALCGLVLSSASLALATSTIPDIGVNVGTTVSDFGDQLGGYLGPIMLLGLAVIAVMFAWRKLRRVG
jgi:hypothetical protein